MQAFVKPSKYETCERPGLTQFCAQKVEWAESEEPEGTPDASLGEGLSENKMMLKHALYVTQRAWSTAPTAGQRRLHTG